MTYSEIVNRIQDVVNQHLMLADFGYGDLSDLKVRFENKSGDSAEQADYPYAFLNPLPHNRSQAAVTYNFNLIVMDMARAELDNQQYNNMLVIQSQCQQYIDDIIAQLYYGYSDAPEVKWDNITYTTFNERFQDDVAGMTANLSIVIPNQINACIAPFNPSFFELLATRRLGVAGRDIDWDGFPEPDPGDDRFFMQEFWDGNAWIPGGGVQTPYGELNASQFNVTVAGKYALILDAAVEWAQPQTGNQLLYGLGVRKNSNITLPLQGSTYLNQTWVSNTTEVKQTATIIFDAEAGDQFYMAWLPPQNGPVPTLDSAGFASNQDGNTIKLYRVLS